MIEEIRAIARRILEEKTVDVVIGYESGTRGAVRPAFIYAPDEADRLVWNDACTHNLANYIRARHVSPRAARRLPGSAWSSRRATHAP